MTDLLVGPILIIQDTFTGNIFTLSSSDTIAIAVSETGSISLISKSLNDTESLDISFADTEFAPDFTLITDTETLDLSLGETTSIFLPIITPTSSEAAALTFTETTSIVMSLGVSDADTINIVTPDTASLIISVIQTLEEYLRRYLNDI